MQLTTGVSHPASADVGSAGPSTRLFFGRARTPPSVGRKRQWLRLVGVIGAALLALSGCVPPGAVFSAPVPISVWRPHDQLRGINLSPKTPLSGADYAALDFVQPGSVVLFSPQLGDADPIRWIGPDPQ